jgi:predicted solute-binding protein
LRSGQLPQVDIKTFGLVETFAKRYYRTFKSNLQNENQKYLALVRNYAENPKTFRQNTNRLPKLGGVRD